MTPWKPWTFALALDSTTSQPSYSCTIELLDVDMCKESLVSRLGVGAPLSTRFQLVSTQRFRQQLSPDFPSGFQALVHQSRPILKLFAPETRFYGQSYPWQTM
jgi:hypothetical protein